MSVTSRFTVPGEWIYRRRQPSRSVYFISRGEVELQQDGHSILLTHGDFVGEAELLHPGRRRSRAKATSFCHLLELSAADFQRLLLDAPELGRRMERISESRQPEPEEPAPPAVEPPAAGLRLVGFEAAAAPQPEAGRG
ncbi:cyclic nucleotide-binding domain-containing protein [Teichococcus aestuarii]